MVLLSTARDCTVREACPLLDEVCAHTLAFRHVLANSLRQDNEVVSAWMKGRLPHHERDANNGQTQIPRIEPASTMIPLRIDSAPYVLGRMTDLQNAAHQITVLYGTARGFPCAAVAARERWTTNAKRPPSVA